MTTLFRLEPIQEVIETVLFTGCFKEINPSSIMLVGPSGVAKTMMLTQYENEWIRRTDSISSQGLFEISKADPKSEIRFLLLADFNPSLSRRAGTVNSMVANLLSFTADGTVRTDDGRTNKENPHKPVGLLTACTTEMHAKQTRKWFDLGIPRRIMFIYFDYTLKTIAELQKRVSSGEITNVSPPKIKIPFPGVPIPTIPQNFWPELITLSDKLATFMGLIGYWDEGKKKWSNNKVIPISPHITLQNLMRAHAARDGRKVCCQKDMDFIYMFLEFSDPSSPKMI